MNQIKIIDSHTGGEPTRVVIEGGPDLGLGPLSTKVEVFRENFDRYRSAIVNEPRGSDVLVGALLLPPNDPSRAAAVIFFNNVGYLGMCGHGTIGLVATLAHLARIKPGIHRIETPVGVVEAQLEVDGRIAVKNVPSYRLEKNVALDVPGVGSVTGDVAWGGNWFFLIEDHGQTLEPSNIFALTEYAWQVRKALWNSGVVGRFGQEIDHIELFAPSSTPGIDSRNFVLCPGKAYDRSPCGTGTSAKLACLFEDGKLKEGEVWRQESIIGSVFESWVEVVNGVVIPTVCGRAHIQSEATLLLDPNDPFCWGVR